MVKSSKMWRPRLLIALLPMVVLTTVFGLHHNVVEPREAPQPPHVDEEREESPLSRVKRFLGLFSVIQFENSPCNSTENGGSKQGICYTRSECQNFGGFSGGSCASGFGVCCIFEYTCQDPRSEAQEILYFQNEDFPQESSEPQICLFSIAIRDESICQLRLDLLEFSLDPGSTEVTPCDRDAVEILSSGVSDLRLGKLCGENGGQHIYLDILNQQTQPMLRVMTDARGGVSGNNNLTMAYRYNIKATQIDCTAPDLEAMMMIRAPSGCLQYHTSREGTVNSFNWSPSVSRIYHPNQDYAICFRRAAGDCGLMLRRSSAAPAMSTSVGQASSYQGPCSTENGCVAGDCIKQSTVNNQNLLRSDRFEIVGLYRVNTNNQMTTAAQYKRSGFFCGIGLGQDNTGAGANSDGIDSGEGILVRSSGPFVIRFVADEFEPPLPQQQQQQQQQLDELGFSIDYRIETSCRNIEEVQAA